ncbi:hypothetical protein CQA53_03825 [Helicobacter didelphidarum]|uniref:Outer membrane beta-barrel protein n=1 Tax=Helicobacter didelphidarum TaxID=2040648 RepID=A0A3D8IM95_9HELI|nr:outer membrane beta-barrel protein [Helicobacter didelphidarum]RDU66359.1 hypothetical protein CQA53_03825 [Helicobacter didelphidarum]
MLRIFTFVLLLLSFVFAQDMQNFLEDSIVLANKYEENPFAKIRTQQRPITKQPPKIPGKSKIEKKKPEEPKQNKEEKKIMKTPQDKQSYEKKFYYLQSLRYEVFSLKQQLGDEATNDVPYGDYIDSTLSAKTFNALAQSYNDAKQKSGLFVGIETGVLDIYTSGYRGTDFIVTRITPIVLGLSGGYQKFFNHYVGTRIYGGIYTTTLANLKQYNINNGESTNIQDGNGQDLVSYYALGFMSVDLLFEFPLDKKFRHYIGGFVGINIGGMYYRPYIHRTTQKDYYPANYIWDYNLQVDYSLNLGVNLTLSNIHRLEIGLNVPLAFLALPGFAVSANPLETTPAQFWRSGIFHIGYKVIVF